MKISFILILYFYFLGQDNLTIMIMCQSEIHIFNHYLYVKLLCKGKLGVKFVLPADNGIIRRITRTTRLISIVSKPIKVVVVVIVVVVVFLSKKIRLKEM